MASIIFLKTFKYQAARYKPQQYIVTTLENIAAYFFPVVCSFNFNYFLLLNFYFLDRPGVYFLTPENQNDNDSRRDNKPII